MSSGGVGGECCDPAPDVEAGTGLLKDATAWTLCPVALSWHELRLQSPLRWARMLVLWRGAALQGTQQVHRMCLSRNVQRFAGGDRSCALFESKTQRELRMDESAAVSTGAHWRFDFMRGPDGHGGLASGLQMCQTESVPSCIAASDHHQACSDTETVVQASLSSAVKPSLALVLLEFPVLSHLLCTELDKSRARLWSQAKARAVSAGQDFSCGASPPWPPSSPLLLQPWQASSSATSDAPMCAF